MGIDVANIHSLSDFQRNAKQHIRKLKKTGEPAVLTVNGQAELVVQSASAYQKLLKDQELVATLRGIQQGLDQAKHGETEPMRQFLEALGDEHGIKVK